MLPIPPSPRSDIERGRTVVRLADAARPVQPVRAAGPVADVERGAPDLEVSVRLAADGTRITVVRRTVLDAGGRRTIGIDAVIR